MPIRPEKWEDLRQRLAKLGVDEDSLIEKFILGSGSGGQKVNKTASCVYLKDPGSGVEVKCQSERSREMNRFYARRRLAEKLEEIQEGKRSAKQQAIEKIRRQKRRRSKRAQEKVLEQKRQRSQRKEMRQPPKEE